MNNQEQAVLQSFIDDWPVTEADTRSIFLKLKHHLESRPGIRLSFVDRPGISYSLRAACPDHDRNLFVLVDVIDDDPTSRWLSVCFYGDMISDPEARGDLIPGGLLGEDGYCFDIDLPDDDLSAYIIKRIDEAHQSATSQA